MRMNIFAKTALAAIVLSLTACGSSPETAPSATPSAPASASASASASPQFSDAQLASAVTETQSFLDQKLTGELSGKPSYYGAACSGSPANYQEVDIATALKKATVSPRKVSLVDVAFSATPRDGFILVEGTYRTNIAGTVSAPRELAAAVYSAGEVFCVSEYSTTPAEFSPVLGELVREGRGYEFYSKGAEPLNSEYDCEADAEGLYHCVTIEG